MVRDCAALLHALAAHVQEIRHRAPAAGSVWQVETAQDATIGDSDFPVPYAFAHHIHRTLMYSAGERVETLAWCLEVGPPHVLSANDLARAAAEAAATAAWLGHAEADGERRLRRLLRLVVMSDNEHRALQSALGVAPDGATKAVLDWASRKSIRQETFGSTTDLLTGVGAARGRVDYQRLSGFTHSVVKSVMVGYIEIDKAQRGDTGLIEVHAVAIATAAAQYVLVGLTSLVRITSASPDGITRLAAWLDDLEDQVARAAQQVDELQ